MSLLLDILVSVSVALGIVGLLGGLLRRSQPVIQATLWRMGLVSVFLLPALVLLAAWGPWRSVSVTLPVLQTPASTAPSFVSPPTSTVPPGGANSVYPAATAPAVPQASPFTWVHLLFLIWGGGVIFVAAWWLWETLEVQRLLNNGRPAHSPVVEEALARWAQALEMRRTPRLVESRRAQAPLVVGWRQPTIVLPAAEAALQPGLDGVLVHELAHILRGDLFYNRLGGLAEMLLWWHPLVWLTTRALRARSEEACDEWAIAHTGERRQYAAALVHWAEVAMECGGASAARRGRGLLVRTRQILDERRAVAMRLSRRCRMVLTPVALLVLVTLAGVRVQLAPAHAEQYLAALAGDDNQARVQALLQANRLWLEAPTGELPYTFRMKLIPRPDDVLGPIEAKRWVGAVDYRGPQDISLTVDGKPIPGSATNLRQGITWSGPLQSLASDPAGVDVIYVGEDSVRGRPAYQLALKPSAHPSPKMLAQWEQMVNSLSERSRYEYEFRSVMEGNGAAVRAIIKARPMYEKGPYWADLEAALAADATKIKWGGVVVSSKVEKGRPALTWDYDRTSSLKPGISLSGAMDNGVVYGTLTILLGDRFVDPKLVEGNRAKHPPSGMPLSCEMGNGLSGTWYGYVGFAIKRDRVWVDKETGMVLRERSEDEDYSYTAEFSDFFTTRPGAAGAELRAPGRVIVTYKMKGRPMPGLGPHEMVFDMRFGLARGSHWLLKRSDYSLNGQPSSIATVDTEWAASTGAPS